MAGSDRPLVSGVPELLMLQLLARRPMVFVLCRAEARQALPLFWPLCYLRMRRNHAL